MKYRVGEPEVIRIKAIAKRYKRMVQVYSRHFKAWVWAYNPMYLECEQYRIKDDNGNYIYTKKHRK